MKFEKPSQEMLTWFENHAPEGSSISKRKMFGYPCRFFNNNMFIGLFESQVFLRLSSHDKEEFLQIDGAEQFKPLPGKIMKEYVIIPSKILTNEDKLKQWITRSIQYVATLPPK